MTVSQVASQVELRRMNRSRGVIKRTAALALGCVLLAACDTRISDAEAIALAREVAPLLKQQVAVGLLPREMWPASVAALDPTAVYVRAEGLYIATSSLLVEERGVFVPRATGSF